MKSKEEILQDFEVLKKAYDDELAGIKDIYAFINMLIKELDNCQNSR